MASITERNGSYLIQVSNGTDLNGKQIRKNTTYIPKAKTPKAIEKEVQKFAKDFEDRVKNGDYLSGEEITFSEFVKIWERNYLDRSKRSVRVKEEYKERIERRVIKELGHMKMSKIKATHIDNIIHKMTDEGKSPATVKHYFIAINDVFKYAYRKEIIRENPCLRCDDLPTSELDTDLHYFTLEQSKRFLKALDQEFPFVVRERKRKDGSGKEYSVKSYTTTRKISPMWKAFFYLSIYGGFRRGELVALNWEDIDFEKKSIRITKSVTKTRTKGQIVKEPKTPKSVREIRLPEECFEILADWRKDQIKLMWELGSAWEGFRGSDFDRNSVFIRLDNGLRVDVDTPTHKFKEIVQMYNESLDEDEEDLRLPNIRLHDLRHTSATLLLASNTDIETVSHRLGHSKASITLDVYGHALETMDEKASDTLEKIFAS